MAHGPDTAQLFKRIADCTNSLDISNLQLTSLPKLPAGLQMLHCSNTRIAALPELPTGLKWLDCSNTSITSLPELPTGLQRLNCSYTQQNFNFILKFELLILEILFCFLFSNRYF